jgi:hypothetical protein
MSVKEYDYSKQHPFWVYQRIELLTPIETFQYRTNPENEYLLFGVSVSFPGVDTALPIVGDISDPMFFKVIHWGQSKPLFEEPIRAENFSSPGCLGYDGTQRQMIYYHKINYLFTYSDVLHIEIRGQMLGANSPHWADILLFGKTFKKNIRR